MLDANYWQERYAQGQTGWDCSEPTPPIQDYFASQKLDAHTRILVPGCGNAHEARWLYEEMALPQVYLCDWAAAPLQAFAEACPDFPKEQLLNCNFFDLVEEPGYDYIVEQTFFCALAPSLRAQYAQKMAALLRPGGWLIGLLFDFPLTEEGPPFGGSSQEYRSYFEKYFEIHTLEACYNSIKPRAGRELFLRLRKV